MLGLSTLGLLHTATGLIAVGAAIFAFLRDKKISPRNTVGPVYIWTSVATAITALGIFRHGGFTQARAGAIVTLPVLAFAGSSRRRSSSAVRPIRQDGELLIHLPAAHDSSGRRDLHAPVGGLALVHRPRRPALQKAVGVFFVLFIAGAAAQVYRIWSARRGMLASLVSPV